MPRSTALRCAYVGCQNRTDRSDFGRIRTLSPDQLSSFSSWLKSPSDGVVCNYHHTLLLRQLERQQKTAAGIRMDELLTAAAAVANTSSSTSRQTPPLLSSPVLQLL